MSAVGISVLQGGEDVKSSSAIRRRSTAANPRTDSLQLSQDVALTLPQIVKSIEAPYREHLAPGTGERALGRLFIDDSKVTDHHAIIPTAISLGKARLSVDEGKIYDLICLRLLSAWQDDHLCSVTTVITTITNGDIIDRYHASGTAVQQAGWKVLDIDVKKQAKPGPGGGEEERGEQVLPPDLAKGQPQEGDRCRSLEKEDPTAQAAHGRHAAHGHGDGGQDSRQGGTGECHEGYRSGDARRPPPRHRWKLWPQIHQAFTALRRRS